MLFFLSVVAAIVIHPSSIDAPNPMPPARGQAPVPAPILCQLTLDMDADTCCRDHILKRYRKYYFRTQGILEKDVSKDWPIVSTASMYHDTITHAGVFYCRNLHIPLPEYPEGQVERIGPYFFACAEPAWLKIEVIVRAEIGDGTQKDYVAKCTTEQMTNEILRIYIRLRWTVCQDFVVNASKELMKEYKRHPMSRSIWGPNDSFTDDGRPAMTTTITFKSRGHVELSVLSLSDMSIHSGSDSITMNAAPGPYRVCMKGHQPNLSGLLQVKS